MRAGGPALSQCGWKEFRKFIVLPQQAPRDARAPWNPKNWLGRASVQIAPDLVTTPARSGCFVAKRPSRHIQIAPNLVRIQSGNGTALWQ